MEITDDAEKELIRLWRATDEHGRRDVMDLARFEVEAAAEARDTGWRIVGGTGVDHGGVGVSTLAGQTRRRDDSDSQRR